MYTIKSFNERKDGTHINRRESIAGARKLARKLLKENRKRFKDCALTDCLDIGIDDTPFAKLENSDSGIVFFVSIARN